MQKSRDKSILRHFCKYQQHVKVAYGIPCILSLAASRRLWSEFFARARDPCPFLLLLTLPYFNVYRSIPISFPALFANAIHVLPPMNVRQNLEYLLHLNDFYYKLHISLFVHIPRIRDYLLSVYIFIILISNRCRYST